MIQVYNTIEFVVFNYFISMRSDLLSIMDPMMLASVYNDSTYVLASFGFNAAEQTSRCLSVTG